VTWTSFNKNDLLIKLKHTFIVCAGLSLKRRLRPDHGDFSDGFLCYAVLEATKCEETKGPVLGWKTWYRLYTNTVLFYKTDFLSLDCMNSSGAMQKHYSQDHFRVFRFTCLHIIALFKYIFAHANWFIWNCCIWS